MKASALSTSAVLSLFCAGALAQGEPAQVGSPPTGAPSPLQARDACPHMVPPAFPREAVRQGISGEVKATVRVENGEIQDIQLEGPEIFHGAVTAALKQYRCRQLSYRVIATQSFNFKIEVPALHKLPTSDAPR
jgi:hypothetical protein